MSAQAERFRKPEVYIYREYTASRDTVKNTIKRIAIWKYLATASLLFIYFTSGVSGVDQLRYAPAKTVIERPAMRVSHIRRPTTSHKRIYMYRRPSIRTNLRNNPVAIGTTTRRRITAQDPSITRTRPTYVRTTGITTTTHARNGTILTRPQSTLSSRVVGTSGSKVTTTEDITGSQGATEAENKPSTTEVGNKPDPTTSVTKKQSKIRNLSLMHALRRMNKDIEYPDLLKKLDFFMSYYPTVREAANRVNTMMATHQRTSREERRRIWKGVFRVKADMRTIRVKCDGVHRNVTIMASKMKRRDNEFEGYKKSLKSKIDQIENHQSIQDQQHFDVYERSVNNTKEIQRLQEEMATLLPLVTGMLKRQEQKSLYEKEALKQLDSHARGNIAEMSNQILMQQNTLTFLGNQVRTEMNQLHEEKQTMMKSLDQYRRKLTQMINTHLSVHSRQINKLDSSLNRQAENVKYMTTVLAEHGEVLQTSGNVKQTYVDEISSVKEGLEIARLNISTLLQHQLYTNGRINETNQAMERLQNETLTFGSALVEQHATLGDTTARLDGVHQKVKAMALDTTDFKQKTNEKTEKLREDLDGVIERQKMDESNITSLRIETEKSKVRSKYHSTEPAPEPPSVSPQELINLLSEIGVEDRMTRLARVLRHQQQRMTNVTRAVLRIAEDNEAIASTSSHYFSVINSQSKVIKEQNQTINNLAMIASAQRETIKSLSMEMSMSQQTVVKLTNIITNLAAKLKSPMGSQRDCHDVWLNGNRKSGVYNVIESMNLRPIYCNLTEYGGWTVIQRRRDGSQIFDKSMREYKHGFGDIYGEYWIGLETIKTLTQEVRSSVALRIILEDWEGNSRTATYSRFYLYGVGYNIAIRGYDGNAGDTMSAINGRHFVAKQENGHDWSPDACQYTHRAGWWFTSLHGECGETNLNGPYQYGYKPGRKASKPMMFWEKWKGKEYPLKSVTMQIIPTDVLSTIEKAKPTPDDNIDVNDPEETLNGNSNMQKGVVMPDLQRSGYSSYEEDLREVGIGTGQGGEYEDNLDYTMMLSDG